MIQQLIALQQQQLAMATNFTAATMLTTKPKYPTVKFPKWDGKNKPILIFLAKLNSYMVDPFFANVTNWTATSPSNAIES